MTSWAIVVAAGTGTRFGRPKQFEMLHGRRVLDWSLDAARDACDGVVLVVPPSRAGEQEHADVIVAGAATRSASVRSGLAAVPSDADVVVVHDAARPLAGAELFRLAIDAVRAGLDAAVCAIPIADTLKQVRAGRVVATLDRRELVAVQTPQAFRADALRRAHATAGEATDDAALVEAAGGRVGIVAGDARNVKITGPHDLLVAAALMDPA